MNHLFDDGLMTSPHSDLSALADESAVTEIEIAADGRLFLFGASREVLELLVDVGLAGKDSQSHVVARMPGLASSLTDNHR
jgi:hypothetical protein